MKVLTTCFDSMFIRLLAAIPLALLTGPAAVQVKGPPAMLGYIRSIPPETAEARAETHRNVAERRRGPVVIVHRGASAFTPENTLEAYAAAMDYGADGCEVDVRRTADGILVLFHDDMLDRLTNGFGVVPDLTYHELLSLKPQLCYGTATSSTRPPTFAALLTLARQRAMLIHLDIKEPFLETAIAEMLDRADAWNQIVAINESNGESLVKNPKYRPLRYKAPGLHEERLDMDPAAVQKALAKPGDMIMVDDPRVATKALKRRPVQHVPIPTSLREEWTANPVPTLTPQPDKWTAMQMLRFYMELGAIRQSPNRLLFMLKSGPDERNRPEGSPGYQRSRTDSIILRAAAAQRFGEAGTKTPEVIRALEDLVKTRSLHHDWMYHGLDGAMAARALGRLHATESAPTLIAAFERIDPLLEKVADPRFKANPLSWTDFRTKMTILPALGELPCDASKQFLLRYLALDPARARDIAPLLYEDATRSVFRQKLSPAEIESLLKNPNSTIRGTAILECLDRPTTERTNALRNAAAWALELPRAAR